MLLVLLLMVLVGLAMTCDVPVTEAQKANDYKWDTIIERCHDVDGHDYAGCLNREGLEWNRGGNDRVL